MSRDRLDISVTNLSNNMIADAAQAPLSVAPGFGKHVGETLTHAWHPVVLALKTMRSLVCSEGIVPPMEELLPSAPLLLPSFRCYLSSSLLYAYSTFSGEYQL